MHFRLSLLLFPSLFFASLLGVPLQVEVNAESALLINADTGSVLYEKNSHAVLPPASITKVATALYALKLKKGQLEEPVTASGDAIGTVTVEAKRKSNYTVSPWWLEPGSAHIGIKKGEVLKFKDLLYGMMLASGDDASNVIAEWAGSGSIPAFMKGLNDYVKGLGCKNSCFMNPHGLYHPDHKTCCYDMALIMREALKDPEFRKVIKTVTYTRPNRAGREPRGANRGGGASRAGLLSDATRRAMGAVPAGAGLRDLGEHRLRGFERPERVWAVLPASQSGREFPPLTTPPSRPTMPPATSAFVGREHELESIAGFLASPAMRVVTLLGPGGVGKRGSPFARPRRRWKDSRVAPGLRT